MSLDQGMSNTDYGRTVQNEQMGQNLNQQQYGDWANQANVQYNQGLQQGQYQNGMTSGMASGVGGIMGMMSVPGLSGQSQQPGVGMGMGSGGQAGALNGTALALSMMGGPSSIAGLGLAGYGK